MSGWLGSYSSRLSQRGRLTLPAEFRKGWIDGGDIRSRVVALAPSQFAVTLLPVGSWICPLSDKVDTVAWTRNLHELILESRVNIAAPIHCAHENSRLSDAVLHLRTQLLRDAALVDRMTGHEFERFLKEVFEAHGIAVQANVRVLGAEIDLLLLHSDTEHGVAFSIVECKHRSRSKSKIDISEVVRVFGLAEALNTLMPIRNRILVTTHGFTHAAVAFANTFGLRAADYEQVIDWAQQSSVLKVEELPIFRMVTIGEDGRLHLDSTLRKYLGSPAQLLVVGTIDRIELWDGHRFAEMIAEAAPDASILAHQVFG